MPLSTAARVSTAFAVDGDGFASDCVIRQRVFRTFHPWHRKFDPFRSAPPSPKLPTLGKPNLLAFELIALNSESNHFGRVIRIRKQREVPCRLYVVNVAGFRPQSSI